MIGSKEFKMLSFESTLKVGLSFLGVVFIIIALSSVLVIIGDAFQTVEHSCLNGASLQESDLNNGVSDCPNAEDESSNYETDYTHNFVSLLFTGLGGVISIAGFFGLFTKMVADAISAGLFLSGQNTNSPLDYASRSSNQIGTSGGDLNEMNIRICPNCERKIGVRESSINLSIRCPSCKSIFKFENLRLPTENSEQGSRNTHPGTILSPQSTESSVNQQNFYDSAGEDYADHNSLADGGP